MPTDIYAGCPQWTRLEEAGLKVVVQSPLDSLENDVAVMHQLRVGIAADVCLHVEVLLGAFRGLVHFWAPRAIGILG